MLRSIAGKTLFEQRRAIIWWSLGLIAMVFTIVAYYPSVRDDPGLTEFIESLPPAAQALSGGVNIDFSSPDGWLNGQLFANIVPLIFIIYGVVLGAGAIGREEDRGTAELLLTMIILVSIILRLGLGEAFVRFHYLDADPERRRRLARTATGTLFVVTTLAAGVVALFPAPVSQLLLGSEQPDVIRAAALGLWAFTNLELAYALLRVEERARAFAVASLINVALTVLLTLWLVVGRDEGALGLLLGNYVASSVVLVGLWFKERRSLGLASREQLGPMLRFGLPTVPAEVSVFALFFVDRLWLYRFESPDSAGLYSLSVKLAAIVIFTVRAFQYAWPPLAYSISDDAEAARVYARITTYYVLLTGLVVAGLTLLGRWVVRIFAAPEFYAAH
ncbi:MAG: oligosaccharide flippase family protein, partial [Solirubrobacterales bacterium]